MLLVYCHPQADSFTAAIRTVAEKALTRAGHEVRVLDLYAMGFDPVLGPGERAGYHTPVLNEEPVAEHLAALRWCEGLLFVYPTWWYGLPAMLKGWLDRVWVPHATFTMPSGKQPISRVLSNIRFLGAVSTLGSPWWWWRFVVSEPGRRMVLRGLRPLVALRAKTLWLALHEIDTSTQAQRERFLERVDARLSRIS